MGKEDKGREFQDKVETGDPSCEVFPWVLRKENNS